MSFIQYNSVKIDGDNNLVLQLVDGGTLKVTLSEFIDKFTHEKDERIKELQEALYDKNTIINLTQEKASTLSAELERLTEERDAQATQITKMLDDFAQKDIATSSELYKQAFNLFIDTKLEEALALLSEARLQEELKSIEQQEESPNKRRRDLADSYLLRAEMLQLKFDFPGAGKCLEIAVSIYPGWKYYLKAGNFFQFINQFEDAEVFLQSALQRANNPEEKAKTLNNLAVLQKNRNEFEKAEANYSEALNILRELATTSPHEYLFDVTLTLNNLAILQRNRNEFEKAETNHSEALHIRRQLVTTSPQTYLPYLANTLNNLAILQKNRNEYDKAKVNYAEALAIYRQLAAANPQTYVPYMATALNNLATLQSDKNEYDMAEEGYNEALYIRRQLATTNPKTYLPYLANTLNNLAALQKSRNEYEKAEENFAEALNIRRKLAEVNPKAYLPVVANALNNLANLQSDRKEYNKAEVNYIEALEIRRQLAKVNPQVYLPKIASLLVNISMLYSYYEIFCDREKAISQAKEAITIALPFSSFIPACEEYLQASCAVLEHWGEDPEAFLNSLIEQP